MERDKINLLIVDDEPAFLESMRKRLEVRGFNVIAVDRGDKALEAARGHPVDIVLLDLKMPGMSGEQTLEALKREHEFVEVVILTGHGSIDSAVECTKSGAYFYLQKPCELERLLEVLADAYKKRVMNKMKVEKERIEEALRKADADTAMGILRTLKEIDRLL
jgi:DNA-binding NtrC family response regulator